MPPTPTPPAQQRPAQKPRPPAAKTPPIPDLETYAEHGDTVEWYSGADPSQKPYCGVVTKVGLGNTLTVNRLSPDLADTSPQDGCRHIDDPAAKNDSYSGGWRHRRITVAVRAMLLKLGLMKWLYTNEWVLVVSPPPEPEPEAPAKPSPQATPAQ